MLLGSTSLGRALVHGRQCIAQQICSVTCTRHALPENINSEAKTPLQNEQGIHFDKVVLKDAEGHLHVASKAKLMRASPVFCDLDWSTYDATQEPLPIHYATPTVLVLCALPDLIFSKPDHFPTLLRALDLWKMFQHYEIAAHPSMSVRREILAELHSADCKIEDVMETMQLAYRFRDEAVLLAASYTWNRFPLLESVDRE